MSEIDLPELPPESLVAVDTETSGLFVDDGARVSIVSIAWYDGGQTPGTQDYDIRNPNASTQIPHSAAYAFDQGAVTPLGEKDIWDIPAKKRPKPSLFDDNIDAAPNLDPHEYWVLMRWLSQHRLVFHNSKFDLHILQRGLRGYEDKGDRLPDLSYCVAWDTQVVNPVLWPEFKTSLKPTAQRLFGEEEADLQKTLQKWLGKNGYRFDLAPWSMVGPYAAKDAEQTLRLYDVQQLIIDSGECGTPHEVREVCDREIDMAITLYRMEARGIGFDADGALVEAEKLSQRIAKVTADLRQEISARFPDEYPSAEKVPPINEHTMRQLWYGKPEDGLPGLGLFPKKMTDKGTASVTLDVVRDLADQGMPFAANYQEMNKLETALSMWYGSWPRQVGPPAPDWHPELEHKWPRLRTNYRQSRTFTEKGGTISGRLAVERVQLQAIPQDYQIPEDIVPIRRFFRADEGYQLWEVDLAQAEYRVAAGISKCGKMIQAFLDGDDAHSATCRLMFGIDEDHPDWDFMRAVAKRLNFGMLYGAGAMTIRSQIEQFTGRKPPLQELQEWLDTYRSTFPELGRANRKAQRQVERTRKLKLAGGRERWFAPFEQEHKAFNQLIQGGVAEMMKIAMVEIEAQIPGVMLLQIHDSVIPEVPEGDPHLVVDRIKSILVEVFEAEFKAPFKADAKPWKGLTPAT